jgi:hypothetical protein
MPKNYIFLNQFKTCHSNVFSGPIEHGAQFFVAM